jgi:hypothetical protein
MPYLTGTDNSSFQAAEFPVKSTDAFAFIKATQGTSYTSAIQAAQADWSRSKKLVTGFYHFLLTGNIQAQAEYFVAQCASVDGDPLVCDWETNPADGKHPTCAEKDAFLKAVKKLRPTHKVGLYCNKSFWTSVDTTSYCADFLWIAAPGTAGNVGIEHPWTFQQTGITGSQDVDIANFKTKADLLTWLTGDEDMALTDSDINKVADAVYTKLLKTDGVIPAGDAEANPKGNPYWSWQTYITETGNDAHSATQKLDTVLSLLNDPAGFLAQLKTELSSLTLKIEAE